MSRDDKQAVSREDLKEFQESRQGLEADLLDEILKSRRVAWFTAIGATAFAVASILVVSVVVYRYSQPLPTHLMVQRPDQSIEEVSIMDKRETYGVAVDRYWLSQFVRHYEQYDYDLVQGDYDAVGLMAGPDVAEQYQQRYKWGTKEAYDTEVGDKKWVRVKIYSVVPDPKTSTATVRFTTTEKYRSRPNAEAPQFWIATIAYSYDNMTLTAAQRLINPAGFRVSTYRVDAETGGR